MATVGIVERHFCQLMAFPDAPTSQETDMAIGTIEQAFAEYCTRLPLLADEARRVALAGGVHEIKITTRATSRRGLVIQMTAVDWAMVYHREGMKMAYDDRTKATMSMTLEDLLADKSVAEREAAIARGQALSMGRKLEAMAVKLDKATAEALELSDKLKSVEAMLDFKIEESSPSVTPTGGHCRET